MLLQWRTSACILPPRAQFFQSSACHGAKRRKKYFSLSLKMFSGSSFRLTSPRAVFLEEFNQLAHNKVLVTAGVSAAIGQLSKPFTSVFIDGKEFDYKVTFQPGGFPSSHSSAVVAAAVSLGLERGLSDSIFGLSVVYAGLVMYDSQGVRREVGNHAKVMNRLSPENLSLLLSEKSKKHDEEIETTCLSLAAEDEKGSKRCKNNWSPLKEQVGHTEVEVIAGAFLGFLVAVLLNGFV